MPGVCWKISGTAHPGLIQGVLVLLQPALDTEAHSASVVYQGEVGIGLAFGHLRLLELVGFSQVLVVQFALEGVACGLGEHASRRKGPSAGIEG